MSTLEKALSFHNSNNFEEAKKIYKDLINNNEKDFNSLCLLGTLEIQNKNYKDGIIYLEKSLRINQRNFIAINNLGLAYFYLKDMRLAEKYFLKSLEINPKYFESYNNLGNIFFKKEKYLKAIKYYKKCLSINNNYVISLFNVARLLIEKRKYKLASKILDKIKAIEPKNAEIFLLNGIIGKRNFRNDIALENFNTAVSLKLNYCEAYKEIGLLHILTKDFNKAEYYLKKAIEIDENFAEAKFIIGCIKLQQGNCIEGWKNYQFRKKKIDNPLKSLLIKTPELKNLSNLKERKIFIYCEQGLGDIIFFYRYILLLENKVNKIFFQIPNSLKYILSRKNTNIEIVNNFSKLQESDFQCSLMDLPYIFNKNNIDISKNIPYLVGDEALKKSWFSKLNKEKFKIGICWNAGKKVNRNENDFALERSFNLNEFAKIISLKNTELICLQKNLIGYENNEILKHIKFFEKIDEENPFMDTVAIIENCNLIISCDTSIVHLSGSLGKETLLILNYNNYWTWGINQNNSIWYDNIRILRQTKPGSWKEPFDEAYEIIKKKIYL